MNEHRSRERTGTLRHSEVAELVLAAAISQARIRRRWDIGKDVLAVLHGDEENAVPTT